MKKKKVVVLLGGMSAEREVSLTSGKAVIKALQELGHEVVEIDPQKDIGEKLQQAKPDIVFNALHGTYGEDGRIQGLLDIMDIPYTHSGVLASALAMDKYRAKILFKSAGIPTAKSVVITPEELSRNEPFPRPFVIKPIAEGSSVGIQVIFEGDEIDQIPYAEVMVEEFIKGREVSVAVIESPEAEAFGVIELRPKRKFYDYTAKYSDDAKTEHIMPAPLPEDDYKKVCNYALKAHKVLGCKSVSRSDFMYNGKDFYILELNTHPGMTPLSLIPEIAAYKGIGFNQLIDIFISNLKP